MVWVLALRRGCRRGGRGVIHSIRLLGLRLGLG